MLIWFIFDITKPYNQPKQLNAVKLRYCLERYDSWLAS